MADVFRTIIVTASMAPLARALAAGLSPRGAGMFTTGLSDTGKFPATHYGSTGLIDSEIAEVLVNSEKLHAACLLAGAEVTRAQCDALIASSDVTEEPPFVVLSRMGLSLINEDISI